MDFYQTQELIEALKEKIASQSDLLDSKRGSMCDQIERQLKKLENHPDGNVLVLDRSQLRFGIIEVDKRGRLHYVQDLYDEDGSISCAHLIYDLQEDAIDLISRFQPLLDESKRYTRVLDGIWSILEQVEEDEGVYKNTEEYFRSTVQREREIQQEMNEQRAKFNADDSSAQLD